MSRLQEVSIEHILLLFYYLLLLLHTAMIGHVESFSAILLTEVDDNVELDLS